MLEIKGETFFRSPLENEMYVELLGAMKTRFESEGRPVYLYRDLLLSTNRDYGSIYCESSIYGQRTINFEGEPLIIDNKLDDIVPTTDEEKELFGRSFFGNNISSLEALVYAFAKIYHKDNCEEYFNETLKSLKTQALLKTFNNLDSSFIENLNTNEYLKPAIDAFIKVMNMSSEEASRFSDVFLFNTTGVYERDGLDNKLKFLFYTPNKKVQYEIYSYGNDSYDLFTNVDANGYLGLKFYNDKIYVTKMTHHNYRIWDLEENKTCNSLDFNNPKSQWTNTTLEELKELINTISEINNSVSLINSTLEDKKVSKTSHK